MKRTLALTGVLAAAAAVIAVAAATSNASPRKRSSECPSFSHVAGFTGVLNLTVGVAASGSSGPSGMETIQLGRVMHQVHVHIDNKRHEGRYYVFGGLHGLRATGGRVLVDDYLKDSGPLDAEGELKSNQSVAGKSFLGGVGIDRDVCEYKLGLAVLVDTSYQGSPDVDPVHIVGFGAWSSNVGVPHDLKLRWVGSETLHTHTSCPDVVYNIHEARGCAFVSSGWMPDFLKLFECGSNDVNMVDPTGNCFNDENPDFKSPAHLSWNLKPILK